LMVMPVADFSYAFHQLVNCWYIPEALVSVPVRMVIV
jgi:hypothetical protein